MDLTQAKPRLVRMEMFKHVRGVDVVKSFIRKAKFSCNVQIPKPRKYPSPVLPIAVLGKHAHFVQQQSEAAYLRHKEVRRDVRIHPILKPLVKRAELKLLHAGSLVRVFRSGVT